MLEEQTQMRVIKNSPDYANERIRREIEASVCYYSQRLNEIDRRLDELEREWDIERTLELNAGILAMTGAVMGLTKGKWNFLSIMVTGFLIQHAVQGWCPPISVFRRIGIRTVREINQEVYALKALRGDFDELSNISPEDSGQRVRRVLETTKVQ